MLPPDFLQEIDPKTKKRNLPLKTVKYIVEKYYDKSKQTKDIVKTLVSFPLPNLSNTLDHGSRMILMIDITLNLG